MTERTRGFLKQASLFAAALLLTPLAGSSQSTGDQPKAGQTAPAAKPDRWLHIRVESKDSKGETVRVNVPLELAEKVLPTINKDRLQHGKVKIADVHASDMDLHALLDAVRTAKDGEYVTVQATDQDVRVAKHDDHLFVHVSDKAGSKKSKVEIKIPIKVVNALFSAGKDELDMVAALHALSAQGDTELVSVKDDDNTVRIWLDAKNVTE
jgi:hypothetical protein